MSGPGSGPAPARLSLQELERHAAGRGWRLRLQRSRRLGVWSLRVGVARCRPGAAPELLGELKGWALPTPAGLHLDSLRVQAQAREVGVLIWAATFAWALEETPCRQARLLAIRDEDRQHRRLVRYFRRFGFVAGRPVGSGPLDLLLRLVWGGSGLLMTGDCQEGLRRCTAILSGPGSGPPSAIGRPDPDGAG